MRKQWVKLMHRVGKMLFGFALVLVAGAAFADGNASDLRSLVSNVENNALAPLLNAIVAISYLAGAGFVVASIFKFKAHKDNPTQIQIGVPITLLLVGVGLLFFPAIVKIMMASLGLSGGGSINFTDTSITGST